MKNKTIIVTAILILSIGGLFWWSRPDSNKAPTDPNTDLAESALRALETFYDFGRISMRQGLVEKTFTVTNSSDRDMALEKITTSCMCTSAYLETAGGKEKGPFGMIGHSESAPRVNETIKAGEIRKVRVVFDPNAHGPAGIGIINRVVILEADSGDQLELEISATVTP